MPHFRNFHGTAFDTTTETADAFDFKKTGNTDVATGDYNADGVVDGADYLIWQSNAGSADGHDDWIDVINVSGGVHEPGGGATGATAEPETAVDGIADDPFAIG